MSGMRKNRQNGVGVSSILTQRPRDRFIDLFLTYKRARDLRASAGCRTRRQPINETMT
jgi:hypothetical protein